MAFIHFDSSYAACGFLIVQDGRDPYDESATILIQTDRDYPGIARDMGWQPCDCDETDGTINCQHRAATDMISEAFDYIYDRAGQNYPALDEYFVSG